MPQAKLPFREVLSGFYCLQNRISIMRNMKSVILQYILCMDSISESLCYLPETQEAR